MGINGNRGLQRKAILILAVLVLAVQAPLPGRASPVTRAEQERRRAEEEKSRAESEAQQLEEKLGQSRQKEQALEEELVRLLALKDILESDMGELKTQIQRADRDYRQAEEKRQRQYDILKKRIQFLYEEGDITYLDILLKAKNIGDVVSQTEYFRQLYEYDQEIIQRYEKLKQEAAGKKELLEEKQSQLEVMEEENESQQKELEGFIAARQKESSGFALELEAAQARAAQAAGEVIRKTEEIRILRARQEEERIRQEQERVRQEQESAGQESGAVGREPGATGREQGGAGREPGGAGREPGGAGQESGSAGTAQDSAGTAGGRSVKSIGGTEFGRNVADYALQFVGNPYVYGGTSLTGGTDCSGYTQSVYRHFGVSIPRTSGEQAGFGREIPYEDMEPGDLVCYSGHVAMYIGGGRIVHASSRKEGIKVSNDPAYRTIVSIRRPWQ
ncbi:NlpC/P60 family protein [Enterocloster bolteae]|uniref:C40 family peptidase n=1 Tax=Enterocloster bolteae TaxID=208479 RepID=UPI001D0936AF|nr:C40 family peptidase [Enterocloster bolteae]MCB6798369.1 NlpC/P60 family protein [Enterocloster bolteae]MCB7235637.1 NlpC/P60 family protein [Enterocloster bolteae]MCG4943450.1 NlpC/P60 family protein [Enterocloster bolteae]MCG4949461.1 NlpC/P60 family protein [Enterocloster bolteae]